MIRFKQAIRSAFLISILVQAVAAHAATYYVATTGSDAHTCDQAKAQNAPRLTIPAGVKCLSGGDTLIIKAGTYISQGILNPPAGTANAYTVIMGDPTEARPILKPSSTSTQRGFYCDQGSSCSFIEMRYLEVADAYGGVKLVGNTFFGHPHHVRIIDNIIHDTFDTGFFCTTSNTEYEGGDHLIQGNVFYNIGKQRPDYGPGTNVIYNPGNRTIIERNTFHNIINGIGIWHKDKYLQNVIVRSNVFYDVARLSIDSWQVAGGSAVHVSVPGGGHQIYNNVVYRSGEAASFTAFRINPQFNAEKLASVHIYNNTIYNLLNPAASAISIRTSAQNVGGPHYIRNNIAYLAGNGIQNIGSHVATNNLTTNPSFTNPVNGDFRLLSGSSAIDKGMALAIVPIDFAGVPRPQGGIYDIGAHEAGDGSTPVPPKGLSIH